MNILLCIYSLMLCMLAVFAYKNECQAQVKMSRKKLV